MVAPPLSLARRKRDYGTAIKTRRLHVSWNCFGNDQVRKTGSKLAPKLLIAAIYELLNLNP